MENKVKKNKILIVFLSVTLILLSFLLGCLKTKTKIGTVRKQPKWNSSTIIYTVDIDGAFEIFAMNKDGTNKINISRSSAQDYLPSWSSKRDKIAFTSDRDGDNEIYVANRDGSSLRKLTDNKVEDISAAFSPDGKFITFASGRDGVMSIYRMNSDGTNVARLTRNYIFLGPAIFSPDGSLLVLKRKFDYPQRVEFFLSDINGKNIRKMDPQKTGHEDPVFSKDGKNILFSSYDNNTKTWQIFSVDTKTGKNLQRLTNDPTGVFAGASYSPDEKQILYRRKQRVGKGWSLWLMDVDGSNKKQITSNEVKSNIGLFSKDGKSILAAVTSASDDELKWQVSVISAKNYKIKRLTNNDYENSWPMWFEARNIP